MKKITFKTIKLATVFMLFLGAFFKVNAQNFTAGSQVSSTGDWFYNTIAKDVNSDGYDDILSIDNVNNLRVILSNGSGGFNAATTLGSSLWTFKAEDLDNDGDVDIVASSIQANTPGFYIYKNNGSGSFTLQSSTPTNITFSNYAVAAQVMDLVVFDANGDGKKDIVLVPYIYSTNGSFDSRTRHFLFTNTSSGSTISFNQTAIISTNQPCIHGMVADIDNDGDQDLVLDGGSGNATEVFKNNSSGNFSFAGYANGYSGGQFFYDWNNDGFLDIITMDGYNGYGLRWKQNDGQGNFAAGVQLLALASSNGFLADMDGDGLVDAVYGGYNAVGTPGYIQVYTNTGCGFSATPNIYSTQLSNNTGIGVTKIDVNQDGKPDVFVSTRGEVNRIAINNIATATAPILSAITAVQNGSRCGSGIVTVGATASNGGTIKWWYAASGGSLVTTGSSVPTVVNSSTPIQSFWVDASLNGCTSARVKVVGVYNGESSTSTSNVTVCSSQLPYSWNGQNYTSSGTYAATGLTNSRGCDSIATLNLIVGTPVTPAITIFTPSATVCSGDNVAFTAIATDAGPSPVYTWYKNGNSAGTGSAITFLAGTLSSGDNIGCVLTANNACQTTATAGSNKVVITVKPSLTVAPISNGQSTITSATLCALTKTTAYYNSTPYGTWSSSNPSVASVTGGSQAGVVTANNNGTATINYSVTAGNGCKSNATLLVTVGAIETNSITGTNNVCVNATTALSCIAPAGTTGVWSSTNDRGVIDVNGVYTGKNAGAWGEARYTVTNVNTGCVAYSSRIITVNPTPVVPTITYAPGTTSNPQAGAPTGSFCVGKVFTVVATPNVPAGVWSSTGVVSITGGGGVTINAIGAGSIKYTYTSAAGCVNSRTMSGNGYTCASRGVSLNNEPIVISNDFTMYPNPAKGFINLNVETLVGNGQIVVTDLYGKAVKTQALSMGTNTVNTSNLSKGFYLASIITSEGKTTKKLVVE